VTTNTATSNFTALCQHNPNNPESETMSRVQISKMNKNKHLQ